MDGIKEFLETSTIHGLTYISSSKSPLTKVFWIAVVIGGFLTAGFFIESSFDTWSSSPVATTIETLPIGRAKFPAVNVCPPEGTFTNMN